MIVLYDFTAQVAELGPDKVIFDGRSQLSDHARGVSFSTDDGISWGATRFAKDTSSGVDCLASLLALRPTKIHSHITSQPGDVCPAFSFQPQKSAKTEAAAIRDFTAKSAQECCAACSEEHTCRVWTLATAHKTEPHKATTCYLMGALTGSLKSCDWCTSGVASKQPSPSPSPSPSPPTPPTGQLAPLLFSHPSGADRSKGVVLRSDDGANTWTKLASATPDDPGRKFGYSSLTLLNDARKVGLTYETSSGTCTSDASACRIMYRTISV